MPSRYVGEISNPFGCKDIRLSVAATADAQGPQS